MSFDKDKFSQLLKQAKGTRSINNYGRISNVDPGYISRLLRCLVETPPSAVIINKLAERAHNEVSAEELMSAAGYINDDLSKSTSTPDWATTKDKRDLKKWLESPEALFFNGIEFTKEDRAKMLGVAESIFWDARKRNKEDYKKNRKNKQS